MAVAVVAVAAGVVSSAARQLGGGADPLLASLNLGSGEDAIGAAALSREAATKLMASSTADLKRSPLSVEDIRNASLAADALGRPDHSRALMAIAGDLSWRDTATQLWLFSDAIRAQRFGDAIMRADALMRRNKMIPQIMPLIYVVGNDPASRAVLVERLEKNPYWRPRFFTMARQADANTVPLQAVVSDLTATDRPATDEELLPVLKWLVDAERYATARDIWLAAHPESRNRFGSNGYSEGFEDVTTGGSQHGPRFGWSLAGSPGIALQPRQDSASGRDVALRVAPLGIDSRKIGGALLILDPAPYILSLEISPPDSGSGELEWEITCLPGKQDIPESVPVSSPAGDWTRVSWEITLPSQGCSAQQFTLRANAGGTVGNAPLLIDNLQVRKRMAD